MQEMQESNTTEEGVPCPPAAVYNIPVAPPTKPVSRITHNGDDKDKQSPTHSSMSPADEMASTETSALYVSIRRPDEPLSLISKTTETPAALIQHMPTPPSKMNRRNRERGSRKKLNRDHTIKVQDQAPIAEDYHLTNPEGDDVSSSTTLPGAVSFEGFANGRSHRSLTAQTTGQSIGDSFVADRSAQLEPQIVAFLAPDDEDQQVVEARIAQKAEELWRRQMEEGEVIVATEMKDDPSTSCGLKKRTLILLGILALLMMIGGVVGGVLSSTTAGVPFVPSPAPTPAPTTLGDALLDELILLNATFEKNLWQFEVPESPQHQALVWLKNDTIVMSSGRSTRDLLQRYVLAVLFYAANGPKWGGSPAYMSSEDVCSWNKGSKDYGVFCRLDGESIDELILSDDSIVGLGLELPWELGLLTDLTILQLDFNQLTGTLPTQLGQLVSLKSLDIKHKLTGTIPTEFGQLRSLEYLDLQNNQLTGPIPTELGQLLLLGYLDLDDNQLTGTIPSELGQLLSLPSININFNQQLTGSIPTELGQLLSLQSLRITNCQLTGTIPTELGQLLSLTSLDMFGDYLTGTIPTEIGQLLSLISLTVSSNQLIGTLPTELGQLLFLQSLDIAFNPLTGTIPTELGLLTSLESFFSTINQLTGTIPTELGQLLSLESLVIINLLTGTIPTELGKLLSLQSLYINSNQLTGTIPTELGHLLSLEVFTMSNNQLTGTIPTELGQLLSLTDLDMSSNQLTGTILTELGQLLSLTSLNLGSNHWNGTIPTEFGQLLSLKSLYINEIPFIGAALSTELTGTIPSELGQLLSLKSLVMSVNQLTGTIPTELGQLLSLTSLALESNQLTGTIPSELAGIASLTSMYIYANSLTGSLEESFCVESRTGYSSTWVIVDCDEVECSCCDC